MPFEQTLARIEQEIAVEEYGKARDRLHGLLSTYPNDLSLRRRLGDVYWALYQPAMAGRYWYLEAEKSEIMETACQKFEKFCQNDPLRMLLALKFKGDFESLVSTYAKNTLLELHEQAKEKYRYYVDFRARGAEKYYQWKSESTNVSTAVWKVGCFVFLSIVLSLVVIGSLTVFDWIF